MKTVNIDQIRGGLAQTLEAFNAQRPFRYVILQDFLTVGALRRIQAEFPNVDTKNWVDASGLHTKKKWTQPAVQGSVAEAFYNEVQSPEFLQLIEQITKIKDVKPDPELFGAGYHQTLDGGFLDIHIDFNYHETTGLDRRLNLIVYLNPQWEPNWGGALELWDIEKKQMIASVPPLENVAVLFETNDISYHGHPRPWDSGGKMSRQSLSTYYYTHGRDDGVDISKHTTLYVNTEGRRGRLKVFANGIRDVLRLGPIRRRLR
jgi:2OG-Fe(II) oxygenase superfamily